MRTLKILFPCLSSPGFVFPSISIAQTLRDRGHQVAFVTGPEFHITLRDAGLVRIPRGEKDGPSFQVPTWFHPMPIAMQYRHIEYAVQQFQPDVLVSSMLTLGSLFVREAMQLPCAVIGFLPYLWPVTDAVDDVRSEAEARQRWRHRDMLRYLNEARTLFKMAPLQATPTQSPFLADLFLQRSIPEIVGDLGALPDRVHLIGGCSWDPPMVDSELAIWLDQARASGESIIYVQHGRTFESPAFWPHVVEALRDRPVRVVASVGRMDTAVGDVPSSWFVRPLVSQGAVLPYADAIIASGTTTAAIGALSAGVPALLIPGGGEQDDVAELLFAQRAALYVPSNQVASTPLAPLVDELLARAELAERARELARGFAALDGPAQAADLVIRLGLEGGPIVRGPRLPLSLHPKENIQ